MDIVIDANILFAALIKKDLTSDLLVSNLFRLYAPEYIIKEFEKYRNLIKRKTERSDEEFDEALNIFRRRIELIPYEEIKNKSKAIIEQRHKRIGHNDLESIKSKFQFLPGTSRHMIDNVLDDIYRFMNSILGHFDESECYYNFVGPKGKGGEKLIKHLRQLKNYYSDDKKKV